MTLNQNVLIQLPENIVSKSSSPYSLMPFLLPVLQLHSDMEALYSVINLNYLFFLCKIKSSFQRLPVLCCVIFLITVTMGSGGMKLAMDFKLSFSYFK